MRTTTLFLLLVIFLTGCTSSEKLLNRGNYDAAIEHARNKLARKKLKEKEITVLEQAYKKANDRDKERIEFLKKEGAAFNWEKIYDTYSNMKIRQEMIKPLLPLDMPKQKRRAVFELVNYDEEIIAAKQKAAEYLYVQASNLLAENNKYKARDAYYKLQSIKTYYSTYKDADQLMQKAKAIGTSHALFKMKNNTMAVLPAGFEDELTKITLSELNRDWIVYHVQEAKDVFYDYAIVVNMQQLDVTPDAVKEIYYTDSKEIVDGWQYVLDNRGNVKKDSLGNDIKIPKYKTITCNVKEVYQHKKGIVTGTIDYLDNKTGQLIKTAPLCAESIFEHRSAAAMGDINALKPENKAKLGGSPAPFPNSLDMILQAGQTLKNMVKDIIWSNKLVLS